MRTMYTVYAIYNEETEKIYIGQTQNLEERLLLHNQKTFDNSYTARFDGVWKVIYSEKASSQVEALKREKQLKVIKVENL